MKYLTLISQFNNIRKFDFLFDKIIILLKSGQLYIDDILLENDVFDLKIIDNELFCTKSELSNLIYYVNENRYIIKGQYYLNSLIKFCGLVSIANGYKLDNFNLKYKLLNLDSNVEIDSIPVFGVQNCVLFTIDSNTIKAFNREIKLLWQSDISHYGLKRYNHNLEEIDPATPNTISGKILSNDETVIVPLHGWQILALNITDGSFKWIRETYGNRLLRQNEKNLYGYAFNKLIEFDISTGEILRELDLSDFLQKVNDSFFMNYISNGKMLFDFNNNYSNILVIDLETLTIESYIENEYRSKMLRVQLGDTIWHDKKVYARDTLSNTLYVYE